MKDNGDDLEAGIEKIRKTYNKFKT